MTITPDQQGLKDCFQPCTPSRFPGACFRFPGPGNCTALFLFPLFSMPSLGLKQSHMPLISVVHSQSRKSSTLPMGYQRWDLNSPSGAGEACEEKIKKMKPATPGPHLLLFLNGATGRRYHCHDIITGNLPPLDSTV